MALPSWVEVPEGSSFPIENLPFGVFSRPGERARVGVAIGDRVVDLIRLLDEDIFGQPSINRLLAGGPVVWADARARITDLLSDTRHRDRVAPHLIRQVEVRMHLPFEVGDYVDFYSSIDHARNLGRILRPGTEPLAANWRHLPVGYHGRAGTIVVSGTPVVRPCGQRLEPTAGAAGGPAAAAPVFGPTRRLDIEAEVAFVVGVGSVRGERVPADRFADHVFGAVLLNDWSARDIQAWEYVPLGPLLCKSFATSVSPWVVPLTALAGIRVPPRPQDPRPLGYLTDADPWALDLTLEVRLNGDVISRPPFSAMYWTPGQQLAHLTANGASLRTGDLYASGTVSGPLPDQRGSLIELAWNGASPLSLPDGSTRVFLEDGDTVTITASAPGLPGLSRVGLGTVTGTIAPAV
jgi:fumarylacetoacetase